MLSLSPFSSLCFMPILAPYTPNTLDRSKVDVLEKAVLLDFGTNWCGHCRAAEALVAEALAGHPAIRHIRIEDGPGRRLGRSFGVRLWPTLILLENGEERVRLVRPGSISEIVEALSMVDTTP